MAAAKPAVPPFRVNMERIQIPRAKIGGAGRNNPTNQLPVDSPPPRPAVEIPLTPPKQEEEDLSSNNNNQAANRADQNTENASAASRGGAPKIVVSQTPPPEPAVDYD